MNQFLIRHRLTGGLLATVALGSSAALVLAQGGRIVPASRQVSQKSMVKIKIEGGKRVMEANGIPDHTVGAFPNAGNPNAISAQSYHFEIPIKPSNGSGRPAPGALFGVAVNGVPFDPGTAELWNNNFQWHYEALSGQIATGRGLGVDANLAHVQPNGAYHYHGLPYGLLDKLDYTHKMALVGWAADGYPVYGNYGYAEPNSSTSGLKKLSSSFRLRSGTRAGGPGGTYDGSFQTDFEYVKGMGDLDDHNGRTGVTPEFPNGTYYYVLTETFPFIPRSLKGVADPSFQKQGGPPPGQGGPQRGEGRGPQQGPGQGGPRQQMGPPRGMVPADVLADFLDLSSEQKRKVAVFKKAAEVLAQEGVMPHMLTELRLTKDQIERLGRGEAVRTVLTRSQLDSAQQVPGRQGPGGPGDFGPPEF